MHGAAGGVGLTAVELGKAMGATAIAALRAQTRKSISPSPTGPITGSIIRTKISARKSSNTRVGPTSSTTWSATLFKASLRCINFEGRIIIIGFASGEILQILTTNSPVKCFTVDGFVRALYHRNKVDGSTKQRGLREIWAKGALKLHISHRFPLAEASEAMRVLLARKSTGAWLSKSAARRSVCVHRR